jgi:hypothetical protein
MGFAPEAHLRLRLGHNKVFWCHHCPVLGVGSVGESSWLAYDIVTVVIRISLRSKVEPEVVFSSPFCIGQRFAPAPPWRVVIRELESDVTALLMQ